MMNNLEKYMNDPDIIDEPMPMREVHAIRLMLQDETKDMTPEQHTEYYRESSRRLEQISGIKFRRPNTPISRGTAQ